MILARQFRRDVFVKGRVSLGEAEARARWLATRFALTTPGTVSDMTFDTALGKLQLSPELHDPLIDILAQGPATLHDIIERLPAPRPGWVSLTDVIKVLVGRGDVQPCLPAAGDSRREASTRAFNGALLARATESAEFGYLASPMTGGGVRVSRFTQMYLLAQRQGIADPKAALTKLAERAATDGETQSPEEGRAALEKELARIENAVLPLLRRVGID
jgi:hypothetical protein